MKRTVFYILFILIVTSCFTFSSFADTTVFTFDFEGENVFVENEGGVTLKNISVKNAHSLEKGENCGINGSTALYMKSSEDDIDGTTCYFLVNPINVNAGETYTLSWKMNFTDIGNRGYRMHFYYSEDGKTHNIKPEDAIEPINLYLDDIGLDEGWVTYTYTFTVPEGMLSIRFGPQSAYGTCFYLDDLTLSLVEKTQSSPDDTLTSDPTISPNTETASPFETTPNSTPETDLAEKQNDGGYAVFVMIIAFVLILILIFFIPVLQKKNRK